MMQPISPKELKIGQTIQIKESSWMICKTLVIKDFELCRICPEKTCYRFTILDERESRWCTYKSREYYLINKNTINKMTEV